MMRLSGWVRLWMLLSVIYLGVVTAISTMMLPSENSVTSADVLRYLSTPTLLKMKVAAKSDEWTEEKRGHRSIPVPIRLSQTERSRAHRSPVVGGSLHYSCTAWLRDRLGPKRFP